MKKAFLSKHARVFVVGLGIAGSAAASNADIIFNITGTANSSDLGYTLGDIRTFSFTVNSAFADNADSSFLSQNYWRDELVEQAPIFSDVSGDGLTGSWTRPTNSFDDPYSYIQNVDSLPDVLRLYAGNDGGYSLGLQANGNDLKSVTADNLDIGLDYSFPGSYTDPTVYFTSLTGSYSAAGGLITLVKTDDASVEFTVTDVEIVQTIPEPTGVILLGLGALVVTTRFKSRRSTA